MRTLLRTRVGKVLLLIVLLSILGCFGAAGWEVRSFLQHDAHFRIDSSASVEATGSTELSRDALVRVFGSDIGRNVFFVPLQTREAELEAQPWVKHATVMRILPNSLRVTIVERVPIAFVRVGHQISLVDAEGVLLSMPPATLAARHYSFPVVTGLDPNGPADARVERMHLYQGFVNALNAGGANVSSQLSEVDLSDLDDVRAVVPAQGTDILLHFGNSDYLERWRSYQEHLAEWRQQYPNLSAVDLRYDRQVVLKMADAAHADEAEEHKPLAPEAAAPTKRAAAPVRHIQVRPLHTPVHAVAHGHAAGAKTWYTLQRPATGKHGAQWKAHTSPATTRSR